MEKRIPWTGKVIIFLVKNGKIKKYKKQELLAVRLRDLKELLPNRSFYSIADRLCAYGQGYKFKDEDGKIWFGVKRSFAESYYKLKMLS